MIVRGRRFVSFWRAQGTGAALKLMRVKIGDAIAGRQIFNDVIAMAALPRTSAESTSIKEVIARRFSALHPLPTHRIPSAALPRITLVTDSVASGSLFGGVGTALLLAAMLANRMNATLRVLTRTEKATPGNVSLILNAYGIELANEMQFAFAASHEVVSEASASEVGIHPDEIFITTSWWTTAATLPSVPASSIIYLLQEDERMFYPFGEDRLHCEQVLQNRDIRYVINTRLLYDHLIGNGMEHLSSQGQWFEPSFPRALFHERPREPEAKRRFFFYARPHNSRNLFHVGLAVIDRAVNEGVLDLDRWDICLVGKDIPNVTFGDGYVPQRFEGLAWQAYADLVGTIDLGLSLMYTPHPSYPPLDLAASGAVVVTNRFGNKQDLSRYSRNILCADLDIDALVAAIKDGIVLADDRETRQRNLAGNGLGLDWAESFEGVLQSLAVTR